MAILVVTLILVILLLFDGFGTNEYYSIGRFLIRTASGGRWPPPSASWAWGLISGLLSASVFLLLLFGCLVLWGHVS